MRRFDTEAEKHIHTSDGRSAPDPTRPSRKVCQSAPETWIARRYVRTYRSEDGPLGQSRPEPNKVHRTQGDECARLGHLFGYLLGARERRCSSTSTDSASAELKYNEVGGPTRAQPRDHAPRGMRGPIQCECAYPKFRWTCDVRWGDGATIAWDMWDACAARARPSSHGASWPVGPRPVARDAHSPLWGKWQCSLSVLNGRRRHAEQPEFLEGACWTTQHALWRRRVQYCIVVACGVERCGVLRRRSAYVSGILSVPERRASGKDHGLTRVARWLGEIAS